MIKKYYILLFLFSFSLIKSADTKKEYTLHTGGKVKNNPSIVLNKLAKLKQQFGEDNLNQLYNCCKSHDESEWNKYPLFLSSQDFNIKIINAWEKLNLSSSNVMDSDTIKAVLACIQEPSFFSMCWGDELVFNDPVTGEIFDNSVWKKKND